MAPAQEEEENGRGVGKGEGRGSGEEWRKVEGVDEGGTRRTKGEGQGTQRYFCSGRLAQLLFALRRALPFRNVHLQPPMPPLPSILSCRGHICLDLAKPTRPRPTRPRSTPKHDLLSHGFSHNI